jgi:hypothetical protein
MKKEITYRAIIATIFYIIGYMFGWDSGYDVGYADGYAYALSPENLMNLGMEFALQVAQMYLGF